MSVTDYEGLEGKKLRAEANHAGDERSRLMTEATAKFDAGEKDEGHKLMAKAKVQGELMHSKNEEAACVIIKYVNSCGGYNFVNLQDSSCISRCGKAMGDIAYLLHCESNECLSCFDPAPNLVSIETVECKGCKTVILKDKLNMHWPKCAGVPNNGPPHVEDFHEQPPLFIVSILCIHFVALASVRHTPIHWWCHFLESYKTDVFHSAKKQLLGILQNWGPEKSLDLLSMPLHGNEKFDILSSVAIVRLLNVISSKNENSTQVIQVISARRDVIENLIKSFTGSDVDKRANVLSILGTVPKVRKEQNKVKLSKHEIDAENTKRALLSRSVTTEKTEANKKIKNILQDELPNLHAHVQEQGNASAYWSSAVAEARFKVDIALAFGLCNSSAPLCITCHHPFTSKLSQIMSHTIPHWYLRGLKLRMTMLSTVAPDNSSQTCVDDIGSQSTGKMVINMQCARCETLQSKVEAMTDTHRDNFVVAATRLEIDGFLAHKNTVFPGFELPHQLLYNFVVTTLTRIMESRIYCSPRLEFATTESDTFKMWTIMDRLRLELNYYLLGNPNMKFPEPEENSLFVYCIPAGGQMFDDLITKHMNKSQIVLNSTISCLWYQEPFVVCSMSPFRMVASITPIDDFGGFCVLRDSNEMVEFNMTNPTDKVQQILEKPTWFSIKVANNQIRILTNPPTPSPTRDYLSAKREYNLAQSHYNSAFPTAPLNPDHRHYHVYCWWIAVHFLKYVTKDICIVRSSMTR